MSRALGLKASFAIIIIIGWLAVFTFARGAEVPAADAEEVRTVIRSQLDAFAADDAARAFALATPAIQDVFGTPQRFIEMVRSAYPAVYRAAAVVFHRLEGSERVVSQAVQISDAHGGVWLVIYSLERQADRHWRIAGCEILRSGGRTV